MIIGLSGYAGVGKDEVAKILAGEGFFHIGMSTPLLEMAYAANPWIQLDPAGYPQQIRKLQYLVDLQGWTVVKQQYPAVREFLQRLGTEGGRNVLGDKVWIAEVHRRCTQHEHSVVTGIRYGNEAEYFSFSGPLWVVRRPGYGPVNEHSSDNDVCAWPDADFDGVIDNDGTLQHLHDVVLSMLVADRS